MILCVKGNSKKKQSTKYAEICYNVTIHSRISKARNFIQVLNKKIAGCEYKK